MGSSVQWTPDQSLPQPIWVYLATTTQPTESLYPQTPMLGGARILAIWCLIVLIHQEDSFNQALLVVVPLQWLREASQIKQFLGCSRLAIQYLRVVTLRCLLIVEHRGPSQLIIQQNVTYNQAAQRAKLVIHAQSLK